jgi:hypothetical protein
MAFFQITGLPLTQRQKVGKIRDIFDEKVGIKIGKVHRKSRDF